MSPTARSTARRAPRRVAVAALALVPVVTGTALAPTASAHPRPPVDRQFVPTSTFVVSGEVAEILAATPDGRTVLYTDSARGELGLVDLTRPSHPRQRGVVHVGGEPTSVATTPDGRYALVVVDTTDGAFTTPSGRLDVVDLRTATVVRSLDLGGQPDSIAIAPDGRTAAVAIENQRDEDLTVGGVEGGLPQAPAGFVVALHLTGGVAAWTGTRVDVAGLPGLAFPEDPEPEFVDVDARGVAAVTLQENNAVVLVDLAAARVLTSFSAGEVHRTDADLHDDGRVSFTEPLTAPREPDGVQWTADGNLVTADEGDLAAEPAGGRGWTVFSPRGRVLWTAGGSAERALAGAGRYPDGRSDDKGAEFEGAEVATFGRGRNAQQYAFIGSERGNAVLTYVLDDDRAPRLQQVLATGTAPEGVLAVPSRDLLLTSNEDDGTISVFTLTTRRP